MILQNNLPVEYASKSLNESQRHYAQIEKETLAIAFAVERFHHYIFGKTVLIESDHKPLQAIFAKPLDKCPPRLQRIRLRLQAYDIVVTYKPGKEMFLADALSRSYIQDNSPLIEDEIQSQVTMTLENIPMTDILYRKFQLETNADQQLHLLKTLIHKG